MNGLSAALWAESLKARRSRVPRFLTLGFGLVPLMSALFMLILKDPERAREWGILGAKAQVLAGVADWPTYLGMLAQGTAVGGLLAFSFVVAWLFGREHSDGTLKELLATPTSRGAIVAAKLAIAVAIMLLLLCIVIGLGLPLGLALDLPGAADRRLAAGVADIVIAGLLTMSLMPITALLAGLGRGYLLPLGCAALFVFLAQIAAATGWGAWFPWSVPSIYSGAAGPRADLLEWPSYVIVVLTGVSGAAGTFAWWRMADHSR